MASPNTIILSVVGILITLLVSLGLSDKTGDLTLYWVAIPVAVCAVIGSLVGYVVGDRIGHNDMAVPTILGALIGSIGIPIAIGLAAWGIYSIFGS
jgi:hypothetical protein